MASDTAELVYADLGPLSAADESGDLHTLVEALVDPLDVVEALVRDTDDGPGWSVVLDVDNAPAALLPWLAQWVGATLPPLLTEAEQRAYLKDTPGPKRGTVAYLTAIAAPFLTGTDKVTILERDTSPYHFTYRVYLTEMGGRSYNALKALYATYDAWEATAPTYADGGTAAVALEAAVRAAKPAGLQMTFQVATGASYADLDAEYGSYDNMEAALATYDVMKYHVPA